MCAEAYAAGLLDGEGCIHINSSTGQLQVLFGMCDRGPLDLLAAHWGGNVRTARRKTSSGRSIYEWTINSSYALEFLRDVQPWLCAKDDQAKVALRYPMIGKGFDLPQEMRELRQDLGRQLKALKQPQGSNATT